jgi:hypothetical protein
MQRNRLLSTRSVAVLGLTILFSGLCYGQFSSSVQGFVQDPSGAGIPKSNVRISNVATSITESTTTDANGNFRLVSLAPGEYRLTVEAPGFSKTEIDVTLLTEQNLNVPVTLKVGSASEAVSVTGEAPLIDTVDSRNQLTLEDQAVAQLPLPGRSMIALVTQAPGVSGLGTMGGGVPGGGGSPGSGVDNYSTETEVDASANGQGTMSNMWVVDGLDVTSGIRQGVLNLTPNPDTVQETSIQVNTFSAEYGRASGIEYAMTTKSGTDQFHGLVSDYFDYQQMWAGTDFTKGAPYAPFHANNISAAIGGPILPHHQFFFFASIEPLRESISTGNQSIQIVDRQFASWAATNYPTTLGTKILNTYVPSGATVAGVLSTAADIYPTTCGTPATNNLPCSLALIDNGVFNSTNFRNGTQWNIRIDKYFAHDRIYGSFFRTTLDYGGGSAIPQFTTTNNTWERAFQVNWTHTFSPTMLNEAIFGVSRVEGRDGETGDFTVPPITVTGLSGTPYGIGFAQGDFIQHNYHWRDVLTKVAGKHNLKFGYEGWFGDDVEPFQGPYSQPDFTFHDLLTLAQDAPFSEGNVMYNPLTGLPVLWEWNAASSSWGVFVNDSWQVKKNLTLTLGLRWDDQGNPYSRNSTTVFGNFYLGPGQTEQDQVANGFAKQTGHALNHAVTDLVSPRLGFAWDPTGHGDWVLRGGAGIYNNWLTQANVQEEFRGNPPGPIQPTFYGATAASGFVLGSGNTPPFGFTYPALAGTSICPTAPCLDAKGGIVGAAFNIGGINPNLKSPQAYILAGTLERKLGRNYTASVGYQGSHTTDLVGNGNAAGIVSYGVDINAYQGDLIQHASLVPTRLNTSFGSITYSANDREANYNGVFFDLKGRFARGFFDASYTRSKSQDDAGKYPTALDPHQYYGPSPWDVPNRFSLTFNYKVQGLNSGHGAIGHATGGWGISSTTAFQTGYPITVDTTAAFNPNSNFTGYAGTLATSSGDYNADGDDFDFPSVASYAQGTSRSAYLHGSILASQFTLPAAFGTEGDEKAQQFRQPNFIESDVSFYKDNHITERLNLQFRFDFFNVFNRVNLGNIDYNLADAAFGTAQNQQNPRNWTVGARVTF